MLKIMRMSIERSFDLLLKLSLTQALAYFFKLIQICGSKNNHEKNYSHSFFIRKFVSVSNL